MFIRRPGVIVTVAWIPVLVSMPFVYQAFQHQAAGWVLYTLCLRAVLFHYAVWLVAVYALNMLLIFRFGRAEVSEREKARWKRVICARVEGKEPYFQCEDTVDRAVHIKMAGERVWFRIRSLYGRR